ncbi:hypothetical protein UB33_13980 [Photobacterium angustum]|uniref:tetratricopeptide repeat protein n=1 Tax=Photobacterium angustum TaxID=661 RepID=UPI0005DEE20E|nr:tetratricopeptide repeat protein [Photobacterium angustum]KJG05322.1 hypothetical protein UB33_13980 [Photobacterium angustum]PSV90784.1 tetratricopeptide repeat protein [Photobacterium angustum]
MSELNRRLNELSQVKLASASQQGSPLRAAEIASIPTSAWPKWVTVGCCTMAFVGMAWWLNQPDSVVTPAMAQTEIAAEPIVDQPETTKEIASVKPLSTIAVKAPVTSNENKTAVVTEQPHSKSIDKSAIAELANMPVAQESLESEDEQKELQSSYDQGYESGYEKALAAVEQEHKAQPKPPAPKPVKSELSIQTVSLTPKELAQVEYLNAEKALEQQNSKQAVVNLESALNYRPDWIMARQRLAALYYGRGNVREAIATLEKGLAKQPNQPQLRLTLAKLLVNENQNQAALAVLNDKSGSIDSQYLAMRGALAQRLNNNVVALQSYQQLVRLASFDGRWWMGLAIAQDRSGNAEKARESYQKALQLGNISASSQQFIQQRLVALKSHRS